MKNIYILFLTSCLCGIALSFAFAGHSHTADGDAGESASSPMAHPSVASSFDEQTAFSVATRLTSDRDAALLAHDRAALQALTAPDSPARTIDDALFENVDDLSSLETVVLDVNVRTETEWEVYSVQRDISMRGGRGGEGQQRCTLWHMEKNPWRLYETSQCS